MAQRLVWCNPWPIRQEDTPEFGSDKAPPILVLSTATDPLTPREGTERAAEQLRVRDARARATLQPR